MNELAACLANELPLLSLTDFNALTESLSAAGSPREAAQAFAESSPVRARLESADAWARARETKARCIDAGITILYPGHANYPIAFFDLPQPPLFLSVIGQLPKISSLSIVGSREPTRLAVDWMREHLPQFHRKRNVAVISGGARGVDQLAHISAIEAEQPTVVFNPAGLLQLYPHDLMAWRDVIVKGEGAIVSEFHPQAEMRKHYFLRRNRLIAAFSRITFVVEARRKSGSLLTACTAVELHRDLCVLPGSPMNPSSQGSTDLLFDGAQAIRDANDLIQFWDLIHPELRPATTKSEDRSDQEDGIGEPDSRNDGEDPTFGQALTTN